MTVCWLLKKGMYVFIMGVCSLYVLHECREERPQCTYNMHYFVQCTSRCIFVTGKIELVRSKFGLGFTAVVTVIASLTMSLGICTFFGLSITVSGRLVLFLNVHVYLYNSYHSCNTPPPLSFFLFFSQIPLVTHFINSILFFCVRLLFLFFVLFISSPLCSYYILFHFALFSYFSHFLLLSEIYPFVVVVIGLENILVIVKAVISTDPELDVKFRIAEG